MDALKAAHETRRQQTEERFEAELRSLQDQHQQRLRQTQVDLNEQFALKQEVFCLACRAGRFAVIPPLLFLFVAGLSRSTSK